MSSYPRLVVYEVGRGGTVRKTRSIAGDGSLTTRDIPMPLVRNMISLHEAASPGSIQGFIGSLRREKLLEEIMEKAVKPAAAYHLGQGTHDPKTDDPRELYELFYLASFLSNEEADEMLVYSQSGKLIGMSQVGNFAPELEDMSCTISNLLVSPKVDAKTQKAIISHTAGRAKETQGQATLLVPSTCTDSYCSSGFFVDDKSQMPSSGFGEEMRQGSHSSHSTIRQTKQTDAVVRCRWR